MDRKSEFERANAYVDGELDRDGRNEVLARAARDPRVAQELADLSKLKSVLEDSIDVPGISLPPAKVRASARPMRRRLGMALAACLAIAAVTGVGWWWRAAPAPNQGLPVAWAVKAHGAWRGAPSGTPLLRPAKLSLDAHVPDLAAAKLRIAHVGEITAPGGKSALVVGYRGNRGCRVTLIIDSAPQDIGSAAIFLETEGLQAMVWQAGRLRYQVLAQGMDKSRFRMIAETVRRGSLDRLPLDERTRMALARSRAASPPCAA